ncbi:MAG: GIY-YIG nuclease family protein [Rhizobium sp.]|nr:GIY-YIG nuclease family protein [Rhizobium sp.]
MSHGVRHFIWRNGRPRWTPSPSLRLAGYQGVDLKAEDGSWLELAAALIAAERINVEVDEKERGKPKQRPLRAPSLEEYKPPMNADGYVYFLWSNSRIKIGFSSDPFKRLRALKVGLSTMPERICVVKGSLAAEGKLHRRFARYCCHGEWFDAVDEVESLLFEMVKAGTADIR